MPVGYASELAEHIKLGMEHPLPKQELIYFSPYRVRAYIGGFGSGKSVLGCSEGRDASIIFPNNRGIICRENYPALKDSTIKTFFEICNPRLIKRYNKNEKYVELINGSEILFRNTKNPEDFKSVEIGWWYIDEADGVEEEVFRILNGRLRIKTVPKEFYFGNITSNPPDEDHWIYKTFVENKPDDYLFVHAQSYENIYLPEGYIEALERDYPEDWVRVYLGGEFGYLPDGEPVYKEFAKRLHVRELESNSAHPIIRGWDFGYHHPAVVFMQEIEGKLYVLYEMEGANETVDVFARKVLAKSEERYPGFKFDDCGDPSGNQKSDKSEKSSIQILRTMGIPIRTRVSNINDGLLIIRILMHPRNGVSDLFFVDPSCKKLIQGFIGAYHYPKKKDQADEKKRPKKDNVYDHVQDALRYGVINNPKLRKWLKKPRVPRENPNSFNAIRRRHLSR